MERENVPEKNQNIPDKNKGKTRNRKCKETKKKSYQKMLWGGWEEQQSSTSQNHLTNLFKIYPKIKKKMYKQWPKVFKLET